MDLLEAKSRIAEALVESIFRRARYEVHPYRPETLPLRFGREDFSPDFRVTPPPARASDGELLVERSEEHTSELQSRQYLVCRLLLEKKKNIKQNMTTIT